VGKGKKLQLVRGTLLFGEIVKEEVVEKSPDGYECEVQRQSLHVIDALRLGGTSLADLPFSERLELIETYCQAVNHDSRKDHVRVRVKTASRLESLDSIRSLMTAETSEEHRRCVLPTLGFDSIKEHFVTNSVLLLKTSRDQLFNTTFISRIQVFLKESDQAEMSHQGCSNKLEPALTELPKDGT